MANSGVKFPGCLLPCHLSFFCALSLAIVGESRAEPFTPPTSVKLEDTRISFLSGSSVDTSKIPKTASNFRLFLRYSAEETIQLEMANYGIELAAGENVTADATFEHIPDHPATIHVRRRGDLKPLRIEVPESNLSSGKVNFEPLPGQEFPMSGAFTLVTRFKTKAKSGTLAARAPEVGKWKPNGKTLFLRGGILTYDIGWVGAIRGGPNLADGEYHIAILRVSEAGHAQLYADGDLVAGKKGFTSKDNPNHVFKIGSTSPDFGGDFNDGHISSVRYWKRALSEEEIGLISRGEESSVNTADYARLFGEGLSVEAKPTLSEFGAVPGFPTKVYLERIEGVTFHEAWIQPLEMSDHAELVANWNEDSLARGEAIYSQLCVTCHGTATQEGSIPLSMKFHDPRAVFKNGGDPFRVWQTLTKGYGMMTPMPQYSTREKYDVIHYLREEFFTSHNPNQLTTVDSNYLAALPRGMSLFQEPVSAPRPPQYELMDFGNVLFGTYQLEPGPIDQNVNIAQKGIAIRLDSGPGGVSQGKAWAVYDHDTMRLGAVYAGNEFVDWKGIDFDGSHGTHTSIVGERDLVNPDAPGWAHPTTGAWDAGRVEGKDGRKFGPIPRDWAQYKGIHLTEKGPVLEYTVGKTRVLESISFHDDEFIRSFDLFGNESQSLEVRLSPTRTHRFDTGKEAGGFTITADGAHQLLTSTTSVDELTKPRHFPPVSVTTKIQPGSEEGPFAVDILTVPDADLNPHQSWMRTSGFDFYPDRERAAICTWMGDVWIVEGIHQRQGELTWKRICSGLFQPLGLKIIDGIIHVTCRDQLARLHDKNGDETIDFIECVNNDHQVTEHFHEFAMGLQTDEDGNFYYAKSARHAKDSLVPHHGTLLRVSANGEKTDILATGFRAANGVCINPDGTFIVTDQEGHWNPKNRINWVNGDGPNEFFGNIYGYSPVTDTSDSAMKNPLCWITNAFDRSPSELLWVPKDAGWGTLNGQLLNLSYGYGKVYVVPHEDVNGQKQGGLCELPMEAFPTGVMRGRFHPQDGQLYACGMFAWAGSQKNAGGFYRIRKTEHPAFVPTQIKATKSGVTLTLSDAVEPNSVLPENFEVEAWDLQRTKNYGSKHHNQRSWKVTELVLNQDGKTITLQIPDLEPTWGMSIRMSLKSPKGEKFERLIHNSIFALPD